MTDGRASKLITKNVDGLEVTANQVQIIIRHEKGFKQELLLELEYYRP